MTLIARKLSVLFLLPVMCAACQMPASFKVKERTAKSDAAAPFDPPNSYPGWASDAPQFQKPAQDLTPEPKAEPGDPLHYFTKDKVVMVRQPSGYAPAEIPRVAIWWTDNNGFHWHKAGYFGREQSSFPFEVEEDGDYGVRFVGPGQEQAAAAPAYPERVYHVDTTLPDIDVKVEPEQAWYSVGQTVTVSWLAVDYHLIEMPVNITSLLDFTADESKPMEIQKGLPKDGAITYQIPAEALEHEIRFRVDALDRAENLGIAYSHALQVVPEPVDRPRNAAKPDEVASTIERARSAAEKPSGGFDRPASPPASDVAAADQSLDLDDVPGLANESRKSFTALEARPPQTQTDGNQAVEVPVEDNQDFASSRESAGGAVAKTEVSGGHYVSPVAQPAADTLEPTLKLQEGTREDFTHGNKLLVPMPATVPTGVVDGRLAFSRPWSSLARTLEAPIRAVWSLPHAQFMESNPLLKGLFLAEQSTKLVAEPAKNDSRFVGLPENKTDPNTAP